MSECQEYYLTVLTYLRKTEKENPMSSLHIADWAKLLGFQIYLMIWRPHKQNNIAIPYLTTNILHALVY